MIKRKDGTTYCPMAGHAERNCPGYPSEQHFALAKAGIGVSFVPGPTTERELAEATRADLALVRDEYHRSEP